MGRIYSLTNIRFTRRAPARTEARSMTIKFCCCGFLMLSLGGVGCGASASDPAPADPYATVGTGGSVVGAGGVPVGAGGGLVGAGGAPAGAGGTTVGTGGTTIGAGGTTVGTGGGTV